MIRNVFILLAAVSIPLSLAGCSNYGNPVGSEGRVDYSLASGYENQVAQDIAKGVAELGNAVNPVNGSGLAKTSATNDVGIQWQPWLYSNGWWTRSGSIDITDQGNTIRTGDADSIKLLTAAQTPMQYVDFSILRNAIAIRHASLLAQSSDGAYADLASNYSLAGQLSFANSDTTLTLSGTVNYSIRAESASRSAYCSLAGSAIGDKVTFVKTGADWIVTSGTIHCESTYKTVDVTYNGNNTATVVITTKSGADAPVTLQVQLN